MQGKTFIQVSLGRILIPLSLLAASVLRQNLISLIYFILLLISPLIARNKHSFSGPFCGYIGLVLGYSAVVVIAQAIFHSYLGLYAAIHHQHYGDVLGLSTNSCQLTDTLQWIGFQRVDAPPALAYHSVRLLLPDAVMLLISFITFKVLRKLAASDTLPSTSHSNRESTAKSGVIKKYIETFGELTIIILLGACSAMIPSVISAFYLLIFLGVIIYWSLNLQFKPLPYGMLKMVVFAYLIFHMVLLYLCQLNFLQAWLDSPDNVYYSRLLGMTSLMTTSCSKPWLLQMEKHSWPYFVNPIVLLCTFIVISLDFAYHRGHTDITGTNGNNELSSIRRNDPLRSSENQLLANEHQPSYDAVGSSPPLINPDHDVDNTNTNQNDEPDHLNTRKVRKVGVTVYNFIFRNSYLPAFFAMLMWAVIYPSWTAFAFLVLGCLLWLFPNSRRASLICSPVLVCYAVCLIGLQYICSINFGGIDYKHSSALFFNFSNNYMISSIGLTGNDYPVVAIMLKMLFTLCFCVVLKELRRENCFRNAENGEGLCLSPITLHNSSDRESSPGHPVGSVDNVNLQMIGTEIMEWFTKYWIAAFYFLLLIMAIQEAYVYRLVYMVLFLFSAITFQLHYGFWRYTLRAFLVVVALYSILAILVIYILSFHAVLIDFQLSTGLEDKWLGDLGFDPSVNYQDELSGNVKLLGRLLVPALLLITVMLQLHLFHRRFMELTDPQYLEGVLRNRPSMERRISQVSSYGGFVGDIVKLYQRLRPRGHDIFYSLCRLATIHVYKLIYFAAMWIITREASALCLVLLVILNLSLFFDPVGTLHKVSLLVAQFWVGLIILAKMLFQLQTVPKDILVNNCTVYFNYTAVFHNHTVVLNNVSQIESVKDDFAWLGLRMLHHGTGEYKNSLPYYIGGYVLVLGGLTVLAMFKIHDFHMYKSDRLPVGVTFPNIKWQQIDSSFVKLMGYLINYAFIKFGLEICTVVSVVAVFYRQDAVGALYILLLGILLLLNICKRSYVRNVWFIYLVVLALMLPAQYISALGLPPTLCQEYPWLNMKNTLRLWLFLPDYFKPPDVQVLIADCIQFLFVALQWRVFRMENIANHPTITAAGDNEELGPRPPDHFKDMHDFLNTKRNSVDVIMSALFSYTFWLCICILFITGTQNINLYCFGYLIFCFYFFWYGLDFTIKDRKFVMKIWNALVYYNFIVILIKTWLQLPGCVYPEYFASGEDKVTNGVNKHCIAPELFSIKCLNKQFPVTKEKVVCDVSDKEAGLIWDIICFVVLLIQRRVFMSSYFLVVVCEEKAQAQLASRGAALINLISTKKIAKQQRNKQRELANISKKLEKIRLRTIRLEGGLSREGWTHFDVIRSADETMFDDFSDDETTTAESMDTVTDQLLNASDREKSNPMKMLVQAIDSGMDDSLKQAGKGKERAKKEPTSPTEADSADVTLDVTHDDGEPPIEEGPSTSAGPAVESAPEEEAHSSSTHDQLHKVAEQAKTTDAWIKKFVISCTKWIIYKLNDMSYDYRTVAKQIDEEQVAVKADLKDKMMNPEQTEEIQPEVRYEDINLEQFEVMWQEDLEKRSLVYRLLNAMYLALIARTEFICYFTMVLCQICNGSLLSLPLPIAAMLWGMLSLPRPAKRFWIVVLSYVMLVVVVKYIFQFGLWPWSSTALIKWNDPRLLFGIQEADPESCSTLGNQEDCQADKDKESHPYYAKYELLVLLSVFIHRSVLKRYGLWKNEIEQEEDFNNVARQSERSLELSGSLPTTDNVAEEGNNVDENDQQLVDSTEQKRSSGCPSILTWYRHIMNGKFFSQGDYYSLMVLCDFINFIISVAAYSSFGPPQYGNVQDYIQQNRVPVSFLIILLVQFALIVIDRALYLRKSVLGKLIFHVLLVIIIHIYMFFVLPAFTSTSFNRNTAAQLWYFIKCVYFGLSAWQIKSGYPSGVIGNFLTKSYGYVNLVLFKAFIICPFLLELRSVMDWMWTKTSMSLSDWFLMEDIFVKLFTLKCFRAGEKEYPVPRAQNRVALVKYGLGGFVLLALIFVIWFPLVIFSFANTIYLVNPPIQCQMTVSIGGFQTIFTVRSQPSEINNITSKELDKLKETFSTSPPATGFLDNFDVTDIRTIRMSGESTAIWGITEPSERALITALRSNDSLAATVTLAFTRRSKKGLTSGTISTEFTFDLEPQSDIRGQLLIQVQNKTEKTVVFPNFLPRYLHLPATGEPTPTSALHCHPCSRQKTGLGMISYHGLGLSLHKSAKGEYWSLIENNNCTQSFAPVCGSEHVESKDLFFVTFNERIAPDAVSFITGIGIIGLYIGMVFVIGQFVRTLTSGGSYTIMFDELPNVDRIMKICKDLYFVRENEQLALEEELFAKLIFLYRSPKMLIHSSKIKVA